MAAVIDALSTDVRQALRRIARTPLMSAAVVVTLALAIAANTTIFSILKPTVLRQLPAPDPAALVSIEARDIKTDAYSALHVTALDALRDGQTVFSAIGAYVSSLVRVETEGNTFDTGVEGVTPEYFSVLGVRMQSGRALSPTDDPLAPLAVITRRLATRIFGDAEAVGRTLLIDGRQVTVIGVTADEFIGVRMDGGDDMFVPAAYLRAIQGADPKAVPRVQQLIGRLAPGVTLDAARAEITGRWPAIQQHVASSLPAAQKLIVDNQRLSIASFARGFSGLRDRYGDSLKLVMALAAVLLIVGCVNLGGLMLSRAIVRQHEFAVRIGLGVSRARLVQQTLVDGVLLSGAALVLALPLARWASLLLTSMVSISRAIPLGQTTPDIQVMLLAAVVSMAFGIAIGLLPARLAATGRVEDVLRGRGTSQRVRGPLRVVLVTQVALSVMLVVVAGLFASTLANLYANDLQKRPDPILFTRLARNPAERATMLPQSYFQQLQERLAAMPGVRGASMSAFYPAYLAFFTRMPMDTITADDGHTGQALADVVTPGFFDTYSITRMRGRDFTWNDTEQSPKVAIVNETLARKIAPEGEIVGRHARVTSGAVTDTVEIVGVVADATVTNIRERNIAGLYRPMMQDLRRNQNPMVHVRVTGDVAAARRNYVDTVNAAGGYMVRAMFTMDEWLDNAVVEQQLIAGMAGAAATLAMTLAAVGLFGLLAYSVAARVREIGVRMSLGATPVSVIRLVLNEGLVVIIPGLVIGIAGALAMGWALRSQLYGVSPTNPLSVAAGAITFLIIAALACSIPARRAAKIQPIDALRQD